MLAPIHYVLALPPSALKKKAKLPKHSSVVGKKIPLKIRYSILEATWKKQVTISPNQAFYKLQRLNDKGKYPKKKLIRRAKQELPLTTIACASVGFPKSMSTFFLLSNLLLYTESKEYFSTLSRKKNYSEKLLGLMGLHKIQKQASRIQIMNAMRDKTRIEYMCGCLSHRTTFGELVKLFLKKK